MNFVRLCTMMSAPHSNGRIRYGVARVREDLTEERLRVRTDSGAPLVEVVRVVDERDLDAHLRERVVELVVGAAVERR
jgi:hypothetical protein